MGTSASLKFDIRTREGQDVSLEGGTSLELQISTSPTPDSLLPSPFLLALALVLLATLLWSQNIDYFLEPRLILAFVIGTRNSRPPPRLLTLPGLRNGHVPLPGGLPVPSKHFVPFPEHCTLSCPPE
jgi:hypothetical protein